MRFCFNDMLVSFSYALDCVEHDLLGVATYHGPRVASISVMMGKRMGFPDEELLDLAGCAILHDNALTEYIQEERRQKVDVIGRPANFRPASHCVKGEVNLKAFPFGTDVSGTILYHHENADGSGPFRKRPCDTPVKAQLIHLADQVDAKWNLSSFTKEKYQAVLDYVKDERGKKFSGDCADAFTESCPETFLAGFNCERAVALLQDLLPAAYRSYSREEVIGICAVMAKIIDYKSPFTRRHSIGIAEKAMRMGEFYGFDEETVTRLYFAGALHDIGKLVVDRDILEKPARLSDREYRHIQNHAYKTYELLSRIDGLNEVVDWAALHHERLDGRGYPFGKKAGELGRMERLIACLDIYQALTEERPYKEGMSHEKTMGILRDMAGRGQIDEGTVEDIDRAYQAGEFAEVNDGCETTV